MADITLTARAIRPLDGALGRDLIAAEAIDVGEIVYIDANGKAALADASAAGTAGWYGVVVSAGTEGALAAAAGDPVHVIYQGPIVGFIGTTPGNVHYLSDTAGAMGTAAGTVTSIVGRALTATILHVRIPN